MAEKMSERRQNYSEGLQRREVGLEYRKCRSVDFVPFKEDD